MCKKKFSGVLLLLLLLIPCFLSASAGTAEASYEIIAAVRQGDYVYQRDVSALSGNILNNLEREFCLAITGTFGETFRENFSLSITVEPLGSLSLSNVLINGYSGSATRGLYTCYPRRSFPAVYVASFFPTFKIRINGNEGDQCRFTVTARDRDHNTTLPTKSFTLTVHNNNVSEHPVITEPQANDSLTLYFPGTTYSNLKGEKVANWRIGTENIISAARNLIADFNISRPNSDSTSFSFHTFYNSTIDGYDKQSIGYLTVYAANQYGYEVSRDIEIKVELAKKYKEPVIDNPTQELSVLYGAHAEAVFTGQYISSWTVDKTNLPGFIQDVTLDYRENSDRCKVNVFLSPDTSIIGNTYTLNLTASNGMGTKSAAATLNIKAIGNKDDYEDPIIDSDETISVVQGKSASAVFTGKYVKRWGYRGNLPSGIDDIKFNYASNSNRCEVIVTANGSADVTSSSSPLSIDIYAYNTIGEESSTPKKLYINILLNDETAKPTIDDASTAKEISIVPGGTATVTFTGQHTRTWRWAEADSSDTNPDIVKNIELNYLSNPARCEVKVTLNDEVAANLTDVINIYACNAVGTEVETPAKLTVKVASTGDNEYPVIDENETVSVIKGGTAKAVFTGKHIRSWGHGTLPEAIHAVELKPADNPNRCDVLVTAADNPAATSAKVTIYAYNAIGEVTSATLTVNIVDDSDDSYASPVINNISSVSVVRGGTAHVSLTGEHIRLWAHGNLPDGIKSLEFSYPDDPNKCTAAITAGSNAATGSKNITIYAYNAIGEFTSATLTVNVIASDTDTTNPTISNTPQSLKVIKGGTASVTFTGSNIEFWSYGSLPDSIKSVERYIGSNSNSCSFLVTASSTANVEDTASINVYAFNKVGERADGVINVTIVNDTDIYPDPVITGTSDDTIMKAGETVTIELKGKNVTGGWLYDPDALSSNIKAIELEYDPDNPETCKVIVTAGSNAAIGNYKINVFAFNEIGSVASTTLSVSVGGATSSKDSSSSGCNSGMSGLTLAGALILIYYLTSRKLKIN